MFSLRERIRQPHVWLIGLLILGVIVAAILGARRRSAPEPETIVVQWQSLAQEVSVTGRVEATETVKLGFEKSGRIASARVDVGDHVSAGDLLVSLDGRAESLEVAKAHAAFAAARVDADIALASAERDVENARAKNDATIDKAKQAVRDTKVEREQTEDVRQQQVRETGDESVAARMALLNERRAEAAYRVAQGTVREALAAAAQADGTVRAAVERARADRAKVDQAARDVAGLSVLEANIALAQVGLSMTTLRSPMDGIVTDVEARVGEIATPTVALVTVQTGAPYEITVSVPEADVTKVSVGQKATVTFDALGPDEAFEAAVTRIDPAATIAEDVATYGMTLTLDRNDDRIRPGMSADVTIRTAERDAVLAVPSRAILRKDGRTFVRLLGEDGFIEERSVRVGLRASNGLVEVIDGLAEGDRVVIALPEEREGR